MRQSGGFTQTDPRPSGRISRRMIAHHDLEREQPRARSSSRSPTGCRCRPMSSSASRRCATARNQRPRGSSSACSAPRNSRLPTGGPCSSSSTPCSTPGAAAPPHPPETQGELSARPVLIPEARSLARVHLARPSRTATTQPSAVPRDCLPSLRILAARECRRLPNLDRVRRQDITLIRSR
ncbi:MAG: hypothetical protein JWM95_1636 [Gemmatimonadetes bacterium]|nr:hypothetical protein [Gemmatimonadota bacterium]